jgi:hypothetical protein
MFRALLAHPQEVLNTRHMVYCVRVMTVGCGTIAVHYRCGTLCIRKALRPDRSILSTFLLGFLGR